MTQLSSNTILIYGAEGASAVLEWMLKDSGYTVRRINNLRELQEQFPKRETALLLYDFNTEACNDKNTMTMLANLRQSSINPIMAIVKDNQEMVRILALNAGADAVLNSDCSTLECLAHIQALIRCSHRMALATVSEDLIKVSDIEMDDSAKVVRVKGNEVDLTPTEYKILKLFMQEPGRVMSNKEIYEKIWNVAPLGADNSIAVHVRHIREKIEENPKEPKYLKVVWGQGYRVG